jgi:hypothetical protein
VALPHAIERTYPNANVCPAPPNRSKTIVFERAAGLVLYVTQFDKWSLLFILGQNTAMGEVNKTESAGQCMSCAGSDAGSELSAAARRNRHSGARHNTIDNLVVVVR